MRKTKVYTNKSKKPLLIIFMMFLIIFTIYIFLVLIQPQKEAVNVFGERLPVLVIETFNQDIKVVPEVVETIVDGKVMRETPNSEKFKANLSLYTQDPHTTNNLKPQLVSEIVINTRGQSSLHYPKKQFTVRLVDENGFENPQVMVNMPKHDKWVLNGMYSDKSLLRNRLAYQIGRQTMDYAPNTRYVELYIKASNEQSLEDQYQGIYLLTEKIERSPSRVDIAKNDEKYSDTSFIMARDKVKIGDEIFESDWNKLEDDFVIIPMDMIKPKTVFAVSYPSQDNMTDKNRKNIIKTVNDFEYALKSVNFRNRNTGYHQHIDVDSFIKFGLIQEITKNIDGGEVSSYFYKDLGEKIKAGPVWDFDMSLKNTPDKNFNDPAGFSMVNTVWYDRLFQDEYFVNRYASVYKKYRQTILNNNNVNKLIDENILRIMPVVEKDLNKWHPDKNIDDFRAEVEELRDFLLTRLVWLDNNIHLVKRITENVVE